MHGVVLCTDNPADGGIKSVVARRFLRTTAKKKHYRKPRKARNKVLLLSRNDWDVIFREGEDVTELVNPNPGYTETPLILEIVFFIYFFSSHLRSLKHSLYCFSYFFCVFLLYFRFTLLRLLIPASIILTVTSKSELTCGIPMVTSFTKVKLLWPMEVSIYSIVLNTSSTILSLRMLNTQDW